MKFLTNACVQNFSGVGDAYSVLKGRKTIEFMSTSYMRGVTFDNAIVVFDEIQNCSFQELDTVMTRIGKNCKIVFCGDIKQCDLLTNKDKPGLLKFISIIRKIKQFTFIEFDVDDIVRSQLIKEYLIAKEES